MATVSLILTGYSLLRDNSALSFLHIKLCIGFFVRLSERDY